MIFMLKFFLLIVLLVVLEYFVGVNVGEMINFWLWCVGLVIVVWMEFYLMDGGGFMGLKW